MIPMLQRIRVITEELQAIHAEISNQISPNSIGQKPPIFDEADAMDFLTDFKGAIDEVRSALWLYIEELSKRPAEDLGAKTTHLLRATEMLRALSQHQQSSRPASFFQEGSFFDRLHTVMDAYANDHHPLGNAKRDNANE
jgi:hypothetical protein